MIIQINSLLFNIIIIQILCFNVTIGSNKTAPNVSALFTPIQIRNVTLRNRICVTPMSMYNSNDGMASDFHLGHLQSFALGGAALVMTESTAVTPDGRISPKDCGLWKDEQIGPFARIVKQIKTYGAVPGIQLSHAGRKASTEVLWSGGESLSEEKGGWPTLGPTALSYGKHIWKVPKVMTFDDIEDTIQSFVSAAKRAVRAGFEVSITQFVESIHCIVFCLTVN